MKLRLQYILVGHEPLPMDNLLEWAAWIETANCQVARDEFAGVVISTIFLGLDHNFWMQGPPILFETMVFGGPLDLEQERYCTWDEAEAGHVITVNKVKEVAELYRMQEKS